LARLFKRIGIVARLDKLDAIDLARDVVAFLRKDGLDPVSEHELALQLGEKGKPLNNLKADLVIVIGGDGTVLRTVHGLSRRTPLFHIGMGTVAFFGEASPSTATETLGKILNGKYIQDNCFMLKTNLKIPDALNDIRIGTELPEQMIEMAILFDGVMIAKDRLDAVVVSTSTGASAYALSAGASVVDPRIEAMVVAPICPLSATFKPHVIPSNSEVSVKVSGDVDFTVVADGRFRKNLRKPREIKIRKSGQQITFLRIQHNFYKRIKRRLGKSCLML
jgi:NAD+ kinase